MLTSNVKSSDLASVLELHRAALRGGMFYSKPYDTQGEIVGAEGTVLVVSGGTLVACTMAARNRMIIHSCMPCTNVANNDGDLFALETPETFDKVLRKFGDEPLALAGGGGRLEIVVPRPGNLRGMFSMPMGSVNGHMLSVVSKESAATLSLEVNLLIAAIRRMPRNTQGDLITVQTSDAGLDLHYAIQGATVCERVPADTKADQRAVSTLFCGSARCAKSLLSVLEVLRKHGPTVQVQISASRLAIWTDTVTVQFFSDRGANDHAMPSTPTTAVESAEIELYLNRSEADIPKAVGPWLRKFLRMAAKDYIRTATTWILRRDCVEVVLDVGIETSVEIGCTSADWLPDGDCVHMNVDPQVTATILDRLDKDRDGCHLLYGDRLLTVESSSRTYQLQTRVSPANFESACRCGLSSTNDSFPFQEKKE